MRIIAWKFALGMLIAIVVSECAMARGGGSNFMNGYGYQRRLQESRGDVAVQSNGPLLASKPVKHRHPVRRRR